MHDRHGGLTATTAREELLRRCEEKKSKRERRFFSRGPRGRVRALSANVSEGPMTILSIKAKGFCVVVP